MEEYNPIHHSIVQGLIRNEPHEQYEATEFHEALLFAIAREIGRVHYNRYQSPWDRWSDDPHIPGIQWRRYVYDCDCPDTGDGFIPRHLEECVLCQPNFGFEDVRFNWYKNPGRGMSVNKDWSAEDWHGWFLRCLANIKEFDVAATMNHNIAPVPPSESFYSAACHVLFGPALLEDPLKSQLASLKVAAEKGQREIRRDDGGAEEIWCFVERGDLSERDVRLIALGVMSERTRAQCHDRPLATCKSES